MISKSILVLLCTIVLFIFASAQTQNQCPTPERLRNRMEAVNPDVVDIHRQLADDGMHDRLYEILTYLREIDAPTTKLECLFGGNETLTRVKDMIRSLNLGELRGCMSRINYEYTKEHEERAQRLENSLTSFEKAFAELSIRTLRSINPRIIPAGAFNNPVKIESVPWSSPTDNYHECEIHRADVFRVANEWYFLSEVTNKRSDQVLGPRERYFYRELITLDKNNNTKIRDVTIPNCNGNSVTNQTGKAWVESWSGKVNASLFRDGSLNDDTGLRMVLEAIDARENDIVMDSDIASNLAILLLPVTLALVPLSLFQDVGTLVTVLYVIATDIMSVLPVAIKGFELIHLSTLEHFARAAYAYGSGDSPVLVVEMWVSKCQLKSIIRTKGIVLLAVAISATIIGLILEFVIRHQVEKFKRINNDNLAKELEIDERDSIDFQGRTSLYSDRIVNYIQKGGSGGLLFHIKQKRELRSNTSFLHRSNS